MTDKELLEQIKAREELEQRGYRRTVCEHCKGTGNREVSGEAPTMWFTCPWCVGNGYTWIAPMMK